MQTGRLHGGGEERQFCRPSGQRSSAQAWRQNASATWLTFPDEYFRQRLRCSCAKRHSATCQTYFEVYRATVVLCERRPKRHDHFPPLSSLVASLLGWMRLEFHARVAHRARRSPWVLSLNARTWKARTSSIYTDAGVLKLVLALMCICYARAPGQTWAKSVRKKREFVSWRLEERKGCRW